MSSSSPPDSYGIASTLPPELFSSRQAFFTSRPHIHHLMGAAVVFRRKSPSAPLQTLVLQRASTDSYPLKWERPGGSISSDDPTVLAGAVRELWEETGLHASYIHATVGLLTPAGEAPPGLGVEAEDELVEDESGDTDTRLVTFVESGKKWGIFTVLVDVEENLNNDCIKIMPEEHEAWAWVTEEQVKAGIDDHGKRMGYVSAGVWRTILEGFRIRRLLDNKAKLELA